ncbi:hypothetical protein NC653_036059 [Populus alba x Populus x berolinensis]|uniref:Uncharacterized protein n=1 Tax=Populus alba x Populus x berolinensis TaxID=444605 RepID=A0AAD6PUG6_9ROSI|nr:hypothetical protein NC653_036059 [Populus alba x Populus x berolinensis]
MTTQTSKTPNESRTVATKVAKRKRKLNRLLLSSLLFSQRIEFSGPLRAGTMLTLLFVYGPLPPESFDTDENRTSNDAAETNFSRNVVKDTPRPGPSSSGDNMKVTVVDWKAQELVSPNAPIDEDRSGEVKMEASLTPDDVIRAGGFGARDDISSFLPVASDSTILDARNYEEPQGEIQRPGLGWTERKQLFCQSLRPSCHGQLFLVFLASDFLWHDRNICTHYGPYSPEESFPDIPYKWPAS